MIRFSNSKSEIDNKKNHLTTFDLNEERLIKMLSSEEHLYCTHITNFFDIGKDKMLLEHLQSGGIKFGGKSGKKLTKRERLSLPNLFPAENTHIIYDENKTFSQLLRRSQRGKAVVDKSKKSEIYKGDKQLPPIDLLEKDKKDLRYFYQPSMLYF